MARLPMPGSDEATWGDVLNEFLGVAHNADGTLKVPVSISTKADDASVVHISGNETINGTKTFSAAPVVPTPTAASHASTKAYVDTTTVKKAEFGLNAKDYGAVGDGTADDTAALQAAILAAEGSTSRTLIIPKGDYKTTDTLIIQEAVGVRIVAYGAALKVAISSAKSAIECKTTPANYWKGRRTTIEGLTITSTTNGVGTGIFINGAHEWYLHSVRIDYFGTGMKLIDTYYGSMGGYNVLQGNIVGIDILGDEVNTINFQNLKINGAGVLAGNTTYGIRSVAQTYLLKFSGAVIEAYDYGFIYSRQVFSVGLLMFSEVYFEAMYVCALDFTQKAAIAGIKVQLDNCYFSEDNKANWIKLGAGTYSMYGCNFKSNRIYIKNDSTYRLSLNTDVAVSQLDFAVTQATSAGDGLVQINGGTAAFQEGNVYLYNSKGDYSSYPTTKSHLASIIDQRAMLAISPFDANHIGRIYPVMSVSFKDLVFENRGVVLKSPGGSYFRITVDDAGTLTTKNVTAIKRQFAPSLSMVSALEIGRREVRGGVHAIADDTTLTVLETGRKVIKSGSVINDASLAGRVFGTSTQAATTSFGLTYFSPYYFDTDIEYFYAWQGNYWGWSGSDASEATNIRAIGTLAQRPVTPAVTYMQYYATDNTTRYIWNGSSWS